MSEEIYKKEWEEKAKTIPAEYKPISMWGYFGYQILFMIPCIGIIILLVFAFGGTKNHNLKNYARSYFCLLILIIILIVMLVVFLGVGVGVSKTVASKGLSDSVIEEIYVTSFNAGFESYEGSQTGKDVSKLISKVISSNDSYDDNQIVIRYNSRTYEDDEISELTTKIYNINSYDVTFKYDSDGYIKTIIITEE